MIGRTPARIRALRPLRHGVIADFEVTEQMLAHFMRRAIDSRFARPQVMLCVPSGLTPLERDAVEEAARAAGARAVHLIEEPLAAAIGADLPIADPVASTVLDIGGGTTEIAVISLGSMVVWRSVPIGGYEMDDALVSHMKREHALEIGEGRAEQLKIEIGSAAEVASEEAEVNGRDLHGGGLRTATVTAARCTRRSKRQSARSSTPCGKASKRHRRNCQQTSASGASCSRGAACSCTASRDGFGLRRVSRPNLSSSRSRASPSVRDGASRSSGRSLRQRRPRSAPNTAEPVGSPLPGVVKPSPHAASLQAASR